MGEQKFKVTLPGGAVVEGTKAQIAAVLGLDVPAGDQAKDAPKTEAKATVVSRGVLRTLKAQGSVPYGLTKAEAVEHLGANGVTGYVAPTGGVRGKIHLRRCSDKGCTHPAHQG